MTPRATRSDGPLYSSVAFDPDLALLVELFVEDLPDRAEMLLDRLQASDSEGLRLVAQQLIGAGGKCGFDDISAEARELEQSLSAGASEEQVVAAVNALIDMCRRARRGAGRNRPDAPH